MDPSQAEW